MTALALLLAVAATLPGTVHPQATEVQTAAPAQSAPAAASREERSLVTLEALRDSRSAKLRELQGLRDAYDPNTPSETRLEQLERIRVLQNEIAKLETDFDSIATGIDLRTLDLAKEESVDLLKELTQFLQPLLSELREATESPREIERLTDSLENIEQHRAPQIEAALANIAKLIEQTPPDSPLRAVLETTLESWKQRKAELENQRRVVQFQLEQRLASRGSFIDSTSSALGNFFRTRGLNLFTAAGAFFGILLMLRLIHRQVRRLLPQRPREQRPFYARLIDVLYFAAGGIAAVSGSLLVLYFAGDWALLGLAILVLLGLAWASKTAAPMFFEQIRILLNFSTVRELERVVFNGLPWRVARISLNALLINPELSGGRLHVPLRDLLALRSRPSRADEAWFPTRAKDWVVMPDGRQAQVELQSPEIVRLRMLGGSLVNMRTTDFYGLGLENLSHGFRAIQRFGIDYSHQAICTTTVIAEMRASLERELVSIVSSEEIRKVGVEFLEASASSLDYSVHVDFEGSVADRRGVLLRAIQRILVDTCTREGWTIPFTQLTVHQMHGGA